jgi:hypothetical protein
MWEMPSEIERISKKPYPWKPIADYNPDCCSSSSAIYYEALGNGVIGVFQVKGLGVLVLRATSNYADPEGKLKFDGMSILSKEEIGYAEKL